MPRPSHTLSVASAMALCICLSAAPALARKAMPPKPPAGAATAEAPAEIGDRRAPPAERMKNCMAAWDVGTHMTEDQWRRTCERELQDDPGL